MNKIGARCLEFGLMKVSFKSQDAVLTCNQGSNCIPVMLATSSDIGTIRLG
jgi:hypothetical protein